MCLIVVGWRAHPDFPLVVAANRDEFHARPSAPASRWPKAPQIFGGRDLEAGGTWLGMAESGRFAAITNVREPGMAKGERSRGALPRDFLLSESTAADYASTIENTAYAGFNLLLTDGEKLVYCSNRESRPKTLAPGIYGLSNHRLDTPWPKLQTARQKFADALPLLPDENAFFQLLADKSIVADDDLPQTGVALEWERLLSAVFVQSPDYGTRASTVAWQTASGAICFHERSFGPEGEVVQSSLISTAV